MIAEHPISGTVRTILGPFHWLWCFLFGFLYYLGIGMWGMALVSLFTINGLLIIMPIMNRSFVRSYYEDRGWRIRS